MKIFLAFAFLSVSLVVILPVGSARFEESNFNPQSNGQALYAQHCARCHGADGKSKTALGRTFKSPDLTSSRVQSRSNTRFTSTIKNGRGNMPNFKKKLSAQDIAALVAYIRSFKK
jgi:mono/diheme cytochrome c family protein